VKGPPLPPARYRTVDEALVAAADHPSGITFVDRETFVPFREVLARARRSASTLRAVGVRPGDRVAMVLPTSPGFLDALFGTLLAGAVPVPLYPPLRLGRLAEYHVATARLLEMAGASLVVVDAQRCRLLGQAIARARPRLGWRRSEELTAAADLADASEAEPDGLALIQFSSGATSDPKPIALSHRQVMAQLAAIRAQLPAEGRDPPLGVSWLPITTWA
jgi:fatty-acyl-CoA synthase